MIKPDDPVKIIDAFDQPVGQIWFDNVAETEFVIFAVIVFCECNRPDIKTEFTIFTD